MEGKENVLLSDERFGRPTPGLRRGCDDTEAGGKEGPPLLWLFGGVNMGMMGGSGRRWLTTSEVRLFVLVAVN